MAIYTITLFQTIEVPSNNLLPEFGDLRCVGWFTLLEEAMCAIQMNYKNMQDGTYNYAIIEERIPGVFTEDINRWLFQLKDNKFVHIPIPKEISKICNFSMC